MSDGRVTIALVGAIVNTLRRTSWAIPTINPVAGGNLFLAVKQLKVPLRDIKGKVAVSANQ